MWDQSTIQRLLRSNTKLAGLTNKKISSKLRTKSCKQGCLANAGTGLDQTSTANWERKSNQSIQKRWLAWKACRII